MNDSWSKNIGFTLKMRRPPKWSHDDVATLRVYCSKYKGNHCEVSETNCPFGITIRYDEEMVGPFWCVGESYDPFKMSHSHEFEPYVPVVPKIITQINASIKPHPDEEKITDDDSYGDEIDKFDDKDPFAEEAEADPKLDSRKDSPISEEFS